MKKDKNKDVTRRDFIKKMGFTATAIGISSAVPKLIKPAQAAAKDHILIGRPLPITGPVSFFSEPSPWLDNKVIDAINKDGGIYIEEYGKKLPVKVKIVDTESNPTKAAELGSMLIQKDKIDIMYVSNTPATTAPVSGNCERFKIPCVCTNNPPEMWLPGGPFHWSFTASVSSQDFAASFIQAWDNVKTNKVVGLLAQNDADGIAWVEAAQGPLTEAGYNIIDLGRFPVGTMDYTTFINGWKKENVEILFANMAAPDFIRAWKQCHHQGFIPKICTCGRALIAPSAVIAIGGDLGLGTSTEGIWQSDFPFKSSLTGETPKDLCDAYEAKFNKQWTPFLGGLHYGWEIVADVLKRAKTLDKETLRNAFAATNFDTIGGHVKFNEENVAVMASGAIQWVKGKKWPFECILVANGNYKELTISGKLISIRELRGIS
jgi:branched-chain amino acid transport system substrate-binding protein